MQNMLRNTLWTKGTYWEPIRNLKGTPWEHIGETRKNGKKKSFSSPKLKRNKSKAPWAFPLAESKINLPPHAQIKLAWKVHYPLSKWTWPVHFPHQIQLEKKKIPLQPPTTPTRAESYSVRLLVKGWCAAGNLGASRVFICMDNWTDSREASFNISTSFNNFIHLVIRSYYPSGFKGSFILLSVRLQGRLHSSFNIYNFFPSSSQTDISSIPLIGTDSS
jgi:hypothetical protein